MAYSPELSRRGSATLCRLAWFRGKPMSKTMEVLLEATGRAMAEIRPGEVCAKRLSLFHRARDSWILLFKHNAKFSGGYPPCALLAGQDTVYYFIIWL